MIFLCKSTIITRSMLTHVDRVDAKNSAASAARTSRSNLDFPNSNGPDLGADHMCRFIDEIFARGNDFVRNSRLDAFTSL